VPNTKEISDIMTVRTYERLSQIYDLGWGEFAKQYISLIKELLNERSIGQARVLDLACGTGILAIELAKLGHFVHGIDMSSDMLKIAKSKSIALSNVSFDMQDMTRFSIKDKYDLVTCTFDSINYVLEADSLRKMLSCVADSLRESGIFVFDFNTHQFYSNRHKGTQEREVSGESFIQRRSYDQIKKEATAVFEFADGAVEVHKQRSYDLVEFELLLTEAGLRMVHVFSGFDKRPYNSEAEMLICVAERVTSQCS